MSVETGSPGGGIGTGISSGGGVGFSEGGSVGIGMGSVGAPAIATAEIGATPSFSSGFGAITGEIGGIAVANPFSTPEALHAPSSLPNFSTSSTLSPVAEPFHFVDNSPLWSVESLVPSLSEKALAIPDSAFSFPTPDSLSNDVSPQLDIGENSLMTDGELEDIFAEIDAFLGSDQTADAETLPSNELDYAGNQADLENLLSDSTLFPDTETVADASTAEVVELDVSYNQLVKEIDATPFLDVTVAESSSIDSSFRELPAMQDEAIGETDPKLIGQVEEVPAAQTITATEAMADKRQALRVLGLVEEIAQEADADESIALGKIADTMNSVVTDIGSQELQTVNQLNVNETAVEIGTKAEGAVTEIELEEDVTDEGEKLTESTEEPQEESKPVKTRTAIRDEATNAKRVDKIANTVEKVAWLAQQDGMQNRVVPGSIVARLLLNQKIEKDRSLTSPIVPKTREDGSLILTLNAVAETDFHEGSIVPAVEGIVSGHTAVTVGQDPKATEDEVKEVLQQGIARKAVIFYVKQNLRQAA